MKDIIHVTLENEFIKFLETEGAREDYDKCLFNTIGKTNIDYVLDTDPDSWISDAFVWKTTNDVESWDSLNDKWLQHKEYVITRMLGKTNA